MKIVKSDQQYEQINKYNILTRTSMYVYDILEWAQI